MDMKTVLISYLISNLICVGVIGALYWQNRRYFNGLGFWLADFVMQFAAILLTTMRGITPDFLSMVVGNGMVIGGTILLYVGLEQFTGKRSAQWHNAFLFIIFILIHSYFAVISPNLTARNINLAFTLLVICAQSAWLLLCKVDIKLRPITRDVGIVFAAYCLVIAGRIVVSLIIPSGDNFFQSNLYDISAVMAYQMLSIALTFSLLLMVNRRLLMELQEDIIVRQQTEEALRLSEGKFFKAFNSSPDLVAITRLSDGRFVEVNEAFPRISGYSREEALNSYITTLDIWTNPQDRESFIKLLKTEGFVRAAEYKYRTKSAEIRIGLLSAEIIQLGNEPHIVSVIHDITERKQAEAALSASEAKYRLLYETMAQGIVYQDGQGKILSANSAAENILGLTQDQMQGRTSIDPRWRSIQEDGSDFPGETHPAMVALREGRHVSNMVMGVFNPETNEYRWININAIPQFRDGESAPYQVYTTFDDITERKQAETALRESRETLAHFINQSPIYAYIKEVTPTQSRVIYASENFVEMIGIPGSEMIGKTMEELFSAEFAAKITADDWAVASGKELLNQEEELNGRQYITIKFPLLRTVSTNLLAGYTIDITERKQSEETLRKSEAEFRKTLEFSPTPIALADISGKLIFLNKNFIDTYGYTLQDIQTIDQWMLQAYPNTDYRNLILQQWGQDVENAIKNNTATPLRAYQVTCKSGEVKTVEITAYFEKELGIGHFQDITERVRADNELHITYKTLQTQLNEINMLKETLQEQAIRDPLTNLHNRRYLNETLGHEVARAKRENYPIGVMLIDIDRFKKFNDTYGHSTGDKVLKSLSRLLVESVRQGDIACRYGGEEFLVVMIGAHETDVERRAEAICHNFSRLRIDFEGQELFATVSIGIAFYPRHGVEIQQVISAADAAMYQAKEAGRNRVHIWGAVKSQ